MMSHQKKPEGSFTGTMIIVIITLVIGTAVILGPEGIAALIGK